VLIHVFTEELHHRGEIIAILWQMDIQPPDMGWISVMKKTNPLGSEIGTLTICKCGVSVCLEIIFSIYLCCEKTMREFKRNIE
jgi:hypothetical protein